MARNVVESLAVGVFERHVLNLSLDGIEAETVGERSIQEVGLIGNLAHKPFVGMVIDEFHQLQTVDYHDDDDADILGKYHQKPAEVVALHGHLTRIELGDVAETAEEFCHIVAPLGSDVGHGYEITLHEVAQHYGRHHVDVRTHAVA